MSEGVHVEYSCRRCSMIFEVKRDLLIHRKNAHTNENSKYFCEICNKGFANHGNMYRHLRGHGDHRPFECKYCGKSFAQAANLTRHYSVHSGSRPYLCSVCNKTFTQPGNLKRHVLIHTGEKPYRCKRCGRMFSQRVNLKKHVMLHQGYKPFVCQICNKGFFQNSILKQHLEKHKEVVAKNEPLKYECAMCSVIFSNFDAFQAHEIFCEIGNEEQIITTNKGEDI